MELSQKQTELVRHALGLDETKKSYRNRYYGNSEEWNSLVRAGLAGREHDEKDSHCMYWAKPKLAQMVLRVGESLCEEDFPPTPTNTDGE